MTTSDDSARPAAPLHTAAQQRPRRVLMAEFPPSGGLFQFAVQLGEALARRGDRVRIVTGPRPELRSREPNLTIESLLPTWHPTAGDDAPEWWRRARRGLRAGQHAAAWARLAHEVRRSRPDVVLWSTWRFPIDGWGVQMIRRLAPEAVLAIVAHEPRPLVEQPGANGEMYKASSLYTDAIGGAYRSIDAAFVLGEKTRRILLDTWPYTGPVTVIPHGDEDVFLRDGVAPADQTGPHALSFGTITGYKGLEDLLAAWPLVLAQMPEAQLTIAGSMGADTDAEAFRATCASLPGVTLQEGYIAVDAVEPLFGAARVVVLPYRRSSQSGVSHLAYTFARPVVATDVGDISAVVRHEQTGLVVPPEDLQALADAVVRVLRDPQLAHRLGQAGRESLGMSSSWDAVADALVAGLPQAPRTAVVTDPTPR